MAVAVGRCIEDKDNARHAMSIRLRTPVFNQLEKLCGELNLSNSAVIHDAIEFYYKALIEKD